MSGAPAEGPPAWKARLGALTGWEALAGGVGLGVVVEGVTAFFRFGLQLESTRDTSWLAALTFGVRIHHGYVGALLLALAALPTWPRWAQRALILGGVALTLSDLAHHFLVLWPITGSPQFDLTYPP